MPRGGANVNRRRSRRPVGAAAETRPNMRDEQLLNTLGREGWEIAAATHQGFVMKR